MRSVSVVIPLYNHGKYIAETLYSVLEQSYPAREIIVVDDGSKDGCGSIVEALAVNNKNIIFWRQPNRGAHNAINAGVARATSDIVLILNSDDIYHRDRLSDIERAFREQDADAVFTDIDYCDGDSKPIAFEWHQNAMAEYKTHKVFDESLINGNFIATTSNIAFKRDDLEAIGAFSNLRYAHDLDFFLRLALQDRKVVHIQKPLMTYRLHGSNTISEGHDRVRLEWVAVTGWYLAALARKKGWGELNRFYPVLEKHSLLRPLLPVVAYFYDSQATTMEGHRFFTDADFRSALIEVL